MLLVRSNWLAMFFFCKFNPSWMQTWYELSECLSEAWWTIDIFKGWAVEKNTINIYENTFGIWIGPCIFLRVFHSHSHTYFVIVTVYTRIKIWPTNFSCTHQMETVIWRMSQSRRKTLHGNALLETLPTTRSLWDCHFSSWPATFSFTCIDNCAGMMSLINVSYDVNLVSPLTGART